MGTFNGTGTMYYGWRHQKDGTAFSKEPWFALALEPSHAALYNAESD